MGNKIRVLSLIFLLGVFVTGGFSFPLTVTTDLTSIQTTPGNELDVHLAFVLDDFSDTDLTVQIDDVIIRTSSGSGELAFDFESGYDGFVGDPNIALASPGLLPGSTQMVQFTNDPFEIVTKIYREFTLPYDASEFEFTVNVVGEIDWDTTVLRVFLLEHPSTAGDDFPEALLDDLPVIFAHDVFTGESEFDPEYTIITATIPEPATIFMFLTSIFGLGLIRRRIKK